MNSKKNFLIVALALSTVIAGALAWQQYQRAKNAPVASTANNDDLAKKLAAAERNVADLEARLAALQSTSSPEAPPPPPDGGPNASDRRGPDRGPGNNNNRRAEMMALLNSPEVQQLMAAEQKAGLDNRYAALFKQLNLSPEQLETFKNLLLEKQNARRDVMTAAQESGLNPRENRDQLRKLVEESNAETDAAIVAAIGQDKFNQYKTYDATSSQRAMVNQLDNVMGYAATPLSDSQSQALVQILSQDSAAGKNGNNQRGGFNGGGGFAIGFGGGGNVTITDAMITQAQSILSPAQIKVLQDKQVAQQNEQKLRDMMRPKRAE